MKNYVLLAIVEQRNQLASFYEQVVQKQQSKYAIFLMCETYMMWTEIQLRPL